MFWGLIMEPQRRYTQLVQRPFHISMAALDIHACDNEPTQVMLYYENRNYLICTLHKDSIQCSLDLNFKAGDKVCFATNGGSNVHLSGYLHQELDDIDEEEEIEESDDNTVETTNKKKRKVTQPPTEPPLKKSKTQKLLDAVDNYDSADDKSFSLQDALEEDEDTNEDDSDETNEESEDADDDEDNSDLEIEGHSDEDISDLENDDDDDEEEEEEEEKVKPQMNGTDSKKTKKKGKVEQIVKAAGKLSKPGNVGKLEKTPNKAEIEKGNKTPKGDKSPKSEKTSKENKTPKNEVDNRKEKKTPNQQSPAKRTVEGGVVVQDLKVGTGTAAKPGKMVEVYYEGRLKQNNKLFDQNKKGNGFRFRLGKHEVIKGWDVGLAGMQVGGRRRIICPPTMAYGQKGSPPVIPSNSTLIFDVELKNVL